VLYDSCVWTGGTSAHGLKLSLVFARVVLAPDLFATGMDLLLERTVEFRPIGMASPELLHWSGFRWRCLSPCWNARSFCSYTGWQLRQHLWGSRWIGFGLQGGYAIKH